MTIIYIYIYIYYVRATVTRFNEQNWFSLCINPSNALKNYDINKYSV